MLALYLALSGCANPETLPEGDVTGRVVIPKAAATRTVVSATDENGDGVYEYTNEEVTDVRLLGPVYIGAYAGIDDVSFPYSHPQMGPLLASGQRGDTFPYGGATVGRLDFACYEVLACKVTTGRFVDYDDLLDYFKNDIGIPVLDTYGVEVTDGSAMRQWCYDYFSATSDAEMAFIGEDNLLFEEEGDNFVADFVLRHTNRVEGMAVWGFMDAPEIRVDQISVNGSFTTCDTGAGRDVDKYASDFKEGSSFFDILNYPSTYIQYGDWVADGKSLVSFDAEQNQKEDVELSLSFDYEGE